MKHPLAFGLTTPSLAQMDYANVFLDVHRCPEYLAFLSDLHCAHVSVLAGVTVICKREGGKTGRRTPFHITRALIFAKTLTSKLSRLHAWSTDRDTGT